MIRIGIIGTGDMANQHASAFNAIRSCRVTACADIVPGKAAAFAARHEVSAAYESADDMLDHENLDGVSVVTIDSAHAPAALAAIRRKIHVMCEKPLADNLADARKMFAAAKAAGVLTAVNFSYRNRPATQKAARMVASGLLGEIRHVEGNYLQHWLAGDWRSDPSLLWRLSTRHGSAGVLGDIGIHLLDIVTFVAGEIAALACDLTVFDKGVKKIGKYVLDANDSMSALVRFRSGARGTLNATRWARGHGNTVALRVYGTKGAIDLDLDRPDSTALKICTGQDADLMKWRPLKWIPVRCPPVPNQQERFVQAIRTGRQGAAGFEAGLNMQAGLEACFKSAREGGSWITA